METASTAGIERRRFLRLVTRLPLVAGAAAMISPLLRFLKPNVDRFKIYAPMLRDAPRGEVVAVAKLSELARPWEFKYFAFTQKYPQYTPEGFKAASVPGVAIRLPQKIRLPLRWAEDVGLEPKIIESDIIVFSRICPHLGCIFNYVSDWREVTAGYGGYVPPDSRKHALIACPCHLSIFDPADPAVPGRVLSGPAPRPPRSFVFEIRGDDIVVTVVEPGGIA